MGAMNRNKNKVQKCFTFLPNSQFDSINLYTLQYVIIFRFSPFSWNNYLICNLISKLDRNNVTLVFFGLANIVCISEIFVFDA